MFKRGSCPPRKVLLVKPLRFDGKLIPAQQAKDAFLWIELAAYKALSSSHRFFVIIPARHKPKCSPQSFAGRPYPPKRRAHNWASTRNLPATPRRIDHIGGRISGSMPAQGFHNLQTLRYRGAEVPRTFHQIALIDVIRPHADAHQIAAPNGA